MKPFVERISVIFVLLCVMQCVIGSEVEHTKSWGDLLSTGSYFTKKETRTGFPFFRREITLTYPRVSIALTLNLRVKQLLMRNIWLTLGFR